MTMYVDKKGRQFAVLHADGPKPFRVVYRKGNYQDWRSIIPIPWFSDLGKAIEALDQYAARYHLREMKPALEF